jgi:hypothetical protein
METPLVTAGIACLIAAIIGGGLKAFGIEIPVLESGRRQVALGALGAVLLAAGLNGDRLSRSTEPVPSEQPLSTPSVPAPQSSTQPSAPPSIATAECSPAWFARPAPARVVIIESGTADAEVLTPDQPKDDAFIVVVTENGRPVGAVAVNLIVSNSLFKIAQVADADCQLVETFRNESRGGDRRVLQNWDSVELTFGAAKYSLRLGYDSGTVGARLVRL